jgi:Ran GTPase-activating protein (RanGAP) involved in mRNA processing and transport
MGASTSLLLLKKDSTIILEALEDVTENGSKSLALQDLPALDLSLVESLVSIARMQVGSRRLEQQLERFSIKDCRLRLSVTSSPSSAAEAMHLLTNFLQRECRSLQEIDLSRNDLHNEDLAILCNPESGLGGHSTLTSLTLRGNRFQGLAGGQCLRQLLTLEEEEEDNDTTTNNKHQRAKLLKLDLSENIWLGIHGIRALSVGLAANRKCLQELVLQECLLDDEGVALLTESMLHSGRGHSDGGGGVKILNLSRNHMTPAALRSLARLLTASSKSCSLQVLDVSHNNALFDEDIRRVEAAASNGSNMTDDSGDIHHTPPAAIASCVKTFAAALKVNETMQLLNVQHCGIENLGAKYMFQALEVNSTLQVLDIGNPYIKSPTGLDYMIQSMPKMKGLQHVKVFIMSTPSPCTLE